MDAVQKFVDRFVGQLAGAVAYKLKGRWHGVAPFKAPTEHKRRPAGHRMTAAQMQCRAPRCRQRSKGPRFHFLCDNHLKKKR